MKSSPLPAVPKSALSDYEDPECSRRDQQDPEHYQELIKDYENQSFSLNDQPNAKVYQDLVKEKGPAEVPPGNNDLYNEIDVPLEKEECVYTNDNLKIP